MLTELFIALGLWWRGTRYAAVWVAVVFHLSIERSAAVQVFSFLAVAVLVVWAVPSTRDRVLRLDPTAGAQRRLARSCARSTGSRASASSRLRPDRRWRLVDRDGTAIRGAPAVALALSRLPLTAWFALPALLPLRPPGPPGGAGVCRSVPVARGRRRAGLSLALLLAVVFAVAPRPSAARR